VVGRADDHQVGLSFLREPVKAMRARTARNGLSPSTDRGRGLLELTDVLCLDIVEHGSRPPSLGLK
jgi:hypothetical protein